MIGYTINDWQQKLNQLNQPLIIVGKHREKSTKRNMFSIQCYKCGGTFEADRNALSAACISREKGKVKTNWCPICKGRLCIAGINDIATRRKDLIRYFKNPNDATKYSEGSSKRTILYCPECGQSKEMRIADLCSKGFYCDYCSDTVSFPNKIIRNLMLQLPVDQYDFEYTDSWCQNKRYDCYFAYDEKKYLVEIDGEQHSKNTSWSTEEWQRNNDLLKNQLAIQNGYEVIRIKAYRLTFDYIQQNILQSKLAEIFNLNHIDWNKIYEKSITNFNIEVGNYYMEHQNMMIGEIAEHFHVSKPTITSILVKMSDLGLCNYSKERSRQNGRKRLADKRTADNDPFILYSPNSETLGVFKSPKECYLFMIQKNEDISFESVKRSLFKGEEYKGYRFEYQIGLFEHHKKYNPKIFKVCDLFNNGKDYKEICQITKISSSTVYKYLTTGNNMGICKYQKRERKAVSV